MDPATFFLTSANPSFVPAQRAPFMPATTCSLTCHACRSQFPLDRKVKAVWEPTVLATVVTPNDYVGSIMQLCTDRRGSLEEHAVLGPTRTLLKYVLPLAELGGDFYDSLKSLSQGFASFDYEEADYR